jgi:phosphoserine phosphatase
LKPISVKKLIIFDVEGIIIPKAVYLIKLFIENRPEKVLNLLLIGIQYYIGLISVKGAIKTIFNYLKGLQEDILISTMKEIELKPGVVKLFKDLQNKGYLIGLITSGIPQQALNYLAETLKVDFSVGPLVTISDGSLTGDVEGIVIDEDGKKSVLESIIREKQLFDYMKISIADDRNNISLFHISDLSIGYRPDFPLIFYCDRIAKGSLREITYLVECIEPEKQGLVPSKILRKTVHLSGIFIPFFLIEYFNKNTLAAFLLFFAIIYLTSEISRYIGRDIPFITWFTKANTLDIEASEFVDAPIYYALGIALTLLIFPINVASAAITVLTLGDSSAMIIGTLAGKTRMPVASDKTLEGFAAFIIASFLGCLLLLKPFE